VASVRHLTCSHASRRLLPAALGYLLLSILGCASSGSGAVPFVPLAQLIVDGTDYDSKAVMTQGFASTGARGAGLYLSEGAAVHGLLSLGLPVDISDLVADAARYRDAESRLDGHWVSIRATFTNFPRGSEAAGGLSQIEAIIVHELERHHDRTPAAQQGVEPDVE